MTNKKTKNEKTKKLVTFMLDEEIRAKVVEWCDKNQVSLSQFIRLAMLEKLERPIISQPEKSASTSVDLSVIELAIQNLNEQQSNLAKSMEYLIERTQQIESLEPSKVEEAKTLLIEKQPKTYDEASKIIPDINTMTESINQLLNEKKIQYKRSRFIWL